MFEEKGVGNVGGWLRREGVEVKSGQGEGWKVERGVKKKQEN